MRDVLAVNLIAPWLLCKLAMPHLRATKGSVVNVASVSGYFGQVGSSAYCASKAGLVGFSKSLAIDEAQHGVRINCVSPGNIWTAAWEKQAAGNAAAIAEGSNSQLLGRFGTPDEVGEVRVLVIRARPRARAPLRARRRRHPPLRRSFSTLRPPRSRPAPSTSARVALRSATGSRARSRCDEVAAAPIPFPAAAREAPLRELLPAIQTSACLSR